MTFFTAFPFATQFIWEEGLPIAGRDLGRGWFICVLLPRENMLDIEIRAGERNLK
jgi:hypothetical protein